MDKATQTEVNKAARILLQAGAKEIFLFGSAARGNDRPESDLDLAVRGLPPERFFAAMSAITFAISRPFDLVDLDEKDPFTSYLEMEGELLRVA